MRFGASGRKRGALQPRMASPLSGSNQCTRSMSTVISTRSPGGPASAARRRRPTGPHQRVRCRGLRHRSPVPPVWSSVTTASPLRLKWTTISEPSASTKVTVPLRRRSWEASGQAGVLHVPAAYPTATSRPMYLRKPARSSSTEAGSPGPCRRRARTARHRTAEPALDHVHRRRTDELCDENVVRVVVHLLRRAACCSSPAFITAIRSPIVMAST